LWFLKKILAILVVEIALGNKNICVSTTAAVPPALIAALQYDAALYGFSGHCQIQCALANAGFVQCIRRKMW
jgi:hypothetical protein